ALHMLLDLSYGELAEMKNARAEHGIRAAGEDALGEIVRAAGTSRGHQRHADRIAHRAGEAEVEALARAVAVHAGEQDLAGARLRHALCPVDDVEAGRLAAAMSVDLPARAVLFGIDGDNDGLVTDDARGLMHQFWILHCSGVDRNLVGPGVEQAPHILHLAHAAAYRERDE